MDVKIDCPLEFLSIPTLIYEKSCLQRWPYPNYPIYK